MIAQELNYNYKVSKEIMNTLLEKGFSKQEVIERLDIAITTEILRMEFDGK